ncbi:hypothetical protein AMTR_s00009p00267690 [Amborella trichopoda]|uniref:protein-serine/threonine phosphatase n=1 Tax=Amborella trichopoda TaxID=13333 RepID=W1NHH4_AMBTC|nr:hypothetical protein AMTR_s00009p00267690 [Amborella trichopoda]
MFKSAVYHGDSLLGEAEVYPEREYLNLETITKEIRISHLSLPSERCPPLAVLHTIASCGVCFKLEFKSQSGESPLFSLYNTCLKDNKTAVMPLGAEELHLVAMASKNKFELFSCFWGFRISLGLYNSCLAMLNLRCLSIVFDLDETLIVANTMRSFEDRIDALQRKISSEPDPQRVSGMLAEVKRYQDDKTILKQYVESDQVVENGKVFKLQNEIVPPLSDSHQAIVRPLIRLQERNIILTRINPVIRDTSVLVRMRPAWEDLRSYLTAKGRKRFEVYVCTMAERDYALEMWRLLDPEANLINPRQLLDRIVCVKSGSRKSLLTVFQDGICHPKMAMVIDDRLKVWDDKDQPRVHVVPPYAPYYAPQAEVNNAVPVLYVARNVACNVRSGFFKDFDDVLLKRIPDVFYEDDISCLPSAPDSSNYLLSEDDSSVLNGNKDLPIPEGMVDSEVERRLKDANFAMQAMPTSTSNNNFERRPTMSLQHVASTSNMISQSPCQGPMSLNNKQYNHAVPSLKPSGHICSSDSTLQCSPGREEGEVPESELDPDTRRRLLILQHGQDTREHGTIDPPPPPFPLRPALQIAVPPAQSHGPWFPVEEEMSPRQLSHPLREFPLEPEAVQFDRHRARPFFHGVDGSIPADRVFNEAQRLSKEVQYRDDRLHQNLPKTSYSSFPEVEEMPPGQSSSNTRDVPFATGQVPPQYSPTPVGVLKDIAIKCGSKVDFRSMVVPTTELQFSVEVWFVGEKIGEGIGKTRKEAQFKASEASIRTLARTYLAQISPDIGLGCGDMDDRSLGSDNGLMGDSISSAGLREDSLPIASTSEQQRFLDQRLEGSKQSIGVVSSLKELCSVEGLSLVFKELPPTGSNHKGEVYAQVEIAGRVLGEGVGSSWEEAKIQAAEDALGSLKSSLIQRTQKRPSSPRLTIIALEISEIHILSKFYIEDGL